MKRTFCDRCDKDLTKESRYTCDLRIKGFSGIPDTFQVDYCEDCLKLIISEERFNELLYRYEERKKRIEEKKAKREEEKKWRD